MRNQRSEADVEEVVVVERGNYGLSTDAGDAVGEGTVADASGGSSLRSLTIIAEREPMTAVRLLHQLHIEMLGRASFQDVGCMLLHDAVEFVALFRR